MTSSRSRPAGSSKQSPRFSITQKNIRVFENVEYSYEDDVVGMKSGFVMQCCFLPMEEGERGRGRVAIRTIKGATQGTIIRVTKVDTTKNKNYAKK